MRLCPPRQVLAAACLLASLAASSRAPAEDLTAADVERLLRELRPSPTDLWRTIPWRISLIDAQHVAASEGKPLFIWAMDGHPLGCT